MRCACLTGWLCKASLRSTSKFGKHCFAPAEPAGHNKPAVGADHAPVRGFHRFPQACLTAPPRPFASSAQKKRAPQKAPEPGPQEELFRVC